MTKRSFEYVNSLNGEHIYKLEEYNGILYDRYWFDMETKTLYLLTRHKYKIIKPMPYGSSFVVSLVDVNNKYHSVSYNKLINEFKKLEEDEN